jgi:hypothetical protein
MMGRKSRDSYEDAVGLHEVETDIADTFEAEFPIVTDRAVEMLPADDLSPDRVALIDGVETGVELTSIKAGSADAIIVEVWRLANKKTTVTNVAASSTLAQSCCSVIWIGRPGMSKARRYTTCTRNSRN